MNTSSADVCSHQFTRPASLASGSQKSPARYVIISVRIRTVMIADSFDSGPSQRGCTMNRRIARPTMEAITATANAAAR